MPSTRPNHMSFYPQNTINILVICCKLILDVETEVWRGSDFDPFWHPFCWIFLRETTQNAHLTNYWMDSIQFFCNDVNSLQEHQNTKKHVIWCSGWSGVDIWLWEVGFTPRPIRHGLPDAQFSNSGAVKSCQAGLPSNTKLENCASGRPCPGSMLKSYPQSPLWKYLPILPNCFAWIMKTLACDCGLTTSCHKWLACSDLYWHIVTYMLYGWHNDTQLCTLWTCEYCINTSWGEGNQRVNPLYKRNAYSSEASAWLPSCTGFSCASCSMPCNHSRIKGLSQPARRYLCRCWLVTTGWIMIMVYASNKGIGMLSE